MRMRASEELSVGLDRTQDCFQIFIHFTLYGVDKGYRCDCM